MVPTCMAAHGHVVGINIFDRFFNKFIYHNYNKYAAGTLQHDLGPMM